MQCKKHVLTKRLFYLLSHFFSVFLIFSIASLQVYHGLGLPAGFKLFFSFCRLRLIFMAIWWLTRLQVLLEGQASCLEVGVAAHSLLFVVSSSGKWFWYRSIFVICCRNNILGMTYLPLCLHCYIFVKTLWYMEHLLALLINFELQ